MSTMGVIEYRGECSVPWGVFSTMGGIMSTMEGIMSTMEGVQYRGGLLFEYPMVLNTPTVLMISPTCIMISPHGTHDIPPRASWYPPQYWTPPWYSRYPSWYPPWYSWYPPQYSWYPPQFWAPPWYCTHIIQDDLLNWRSWKIQTWHDYRHAVHQCFCTKFDSWYLDLTSSILSELDIYFYRIFTNLSIFPTNKSTSDLKFGLLVAWLMMNIYWWNLNSNELKWHHNDVIFFVQFYCYNPCWCWKIFKFASHWK